MAFLLEKKQYEAVYKYDWQRPDFDASEDVFMKHFDENGMFNPKPKNYIELNKPAKQIAYIMFSDVYSHQIKINF